MAKILVTGGCGYIGSHTLVSLISSGYEVVSIDNFINSYDDALSGIEKITGQKVINYPVDLCNYSDIEQVFRKHQDIRGIIHFAALKAVGESVEKPLLYFRNNINSLINVCQAAIDYQIDNFIFSSSCTVYGNSNELPVTEKTKFAEPSSPYGRTKQIGEGMLQDLASYSNLNVISLRYFNPAGAHESGHIGEAPRVIAQNLVPVITETAIGKRNKCYVYGNDYNTRDGSCIRDYIHVMDLADAHTHAVDYLLDKKNTKGLEAFNLGIGEGVTVLEAIRAFEEVTGIDLKYEIADRRPGDVVAIFSNYEKAEKILQWRPNYTIHDIMRTAWNWEQNRNY